MTHKNGRLRLLVPATAPAHECRVLRLADHPRARDSDLRVFAGVARFQKLTIARLSGSRISAWLAVHERLDFWRTEQVHAMKFYTLEIVIEKEAEDACYAAYSPTLPGCFSNGRTIEEAKQHIREAIQQHIEALLARGQPVPQKQAIVQVEELTLGFPG